MGAFQEWAEKHGIEPRRSRAASQASALVAFALRQAARAEKKLRHDHDRTMLVAWACEGLEPADMAAIEGLREALPRRCGGAGHARTRLAHQVLVADRPAPPGSSISAISAVIAAQAARVAAIVASTSAATTVTSS